MSEIPSYTSILIDIEQSDNFLLEVCIQNGEIVIAARFDSLVDPIIFSVAAFRRIVRMSEEVENIIKRTMNANQSAL